MDRVVIEGLSKVVTTSTMLEEGPYDWKILSAEVTTTSNDGHALKLSCECEDGITQGIDRTSPIGIRRTIMLFFPSPQDTSDINKKKIKALLDACGIEVSDDDGFDPDELNGRCFRCKVSHFFSKKKGKTYEDFSFFTKIPSMDII